MLALVAAGCSIDTRVAPLQRPVSFACVRENPAVWSKQFLPELREQLARHGMQTEVFSGGVPSNCAVVVAYTAEWNWDLAVYLEYADITVTDVGGSFPREIGRVTYDARDGSARLDKFGSGSEKLAAIVDRLFGVAPSK